MIGFRPKRIVWSVALSLLPHFGNNLNLDAQVLPFRHYTQKEGLISNRVSCMAQDSRGFLWIGTGEGISIFDGISFNNFTAEEGLSFNFITSIAESRTAPGRIWIGTGRGVTRLENGTFTRYTDSDAGEIGRCDVLEDRSGITWCASSAGLLRLQNNHFTAFRNNIPRGGVNSISETSDGTIWLYYADGLYYLPPSREKVIRFHDPRFRPDSLSVMKSDNNGNLWLLANTALSRLYLISNQQLRTSVSLPSYYGTSLLNNERGTLLIGTPGSGLVQLSTSNFSEQNTIIWTKKNGLLEDDVHPGLIDREGNLWLYGQLSGITVLTDPSIETIPLPIRNLTINNSLAATDSANHLWAATYESLAEFWQSRNKQWNYRIHTISYGASDVFPASVQFDQGGNLFCKLAGYGLVQYRVARTTASSTLTPVRTFRIGKEFPDAELLCFTVDRSNNLWCSFQATGIVKINLNDRNSSAVLLDSGKGIPLESIRAIHEDSKGNIWFGDFSKGLFLLPKDSSRITRVFTTSDGLPDNFVRALFEDRYGQLWIGTRYGGISIFDGKRFQTLSKKDGLLSNAIWCITGLADGSLAIGTDNGAQYINPATRTLRKIKHLSGEHISTIRAGSGGIVWLLTPEGLTIYNRRKEKHPTLIPAVYITSVIVNDIVSPIETELDLEHHQDRVTITFTGIYFRNPAGLRYEYRLGASEDWSSPSAERTVTYAKIQPGEYVFDVRAISEDGIRSDTPSALSFTIASPFWKQAWFIFGMNILAIGLVWLAYKYRTNQLLKIERLRTRISADLHDEIASNLSSIAMFSKIIEEENQPSAALKPHHQNLLNRISSLSQESVQSIRDIIWAIDPKPETLESLLTRLRDTMLIACRANNIMLHFDVPVNGTLPSNDLDPEVRKNLWLLSKEAVHNAIKHAKCKNIRFTYDLDGSVFLLNVEDDGEGFDSSTVKKGKGLITMEMRAKQLHGTLAIYRSDFGGTGIKVSVNLK